MLITGCVGPSDKFLTLDTESLILFIECLSLEEMYALSGPLKGERKHKETCTWASLEATHSQVIQVCHLMTYYYSLQCLLL